MATSWRKIIENIKRNKLRTALALTAAVSAAACCVLSPFLANARALYSSTLGYDTSIYSGDIYSSEAKGNIRANKCRDSMYSDLCILGVAYLSNFENGKYVGTGDLYEDIYANLTVFSDAEFFNENLLGIKDASNRCVKISQSKYNITNIDSDYYNFYVEYDGEYLTNIDGLDTSNLRNIEDRLVEKYPSHYYLRTGDKVVKKTPRNEGGMGKREIYYTLYDENGDYEVTSEYIDSDEFLIGAASCNDFGEYTLCFSDLGDITLDTYTRFYDDYYTDHRPVLDSSDGKIKAVSNYVNDIYYESDEFDDTDNIDEDELRNRITLKLKEDLDIEESASDNYDLSEKLKRLVAAYGGVYTIGDYNSKYMTSEEYDDGFIYINNIWNNKKEPIDTSKLTVFMSPKVDIAKTAADFAESYRIKSNVFFGLEIAFTVIFSACTLSFIVLSILRSAEKYKADEITLISRLFKVDLSLLCIIISVFFFVCIVWDIYYSDFAVGRLIQKGVVTFLVSSIFFISIGRFIANFKINGKTKPKLLISALRRRIYLPIKNKLDDRISKIAIVKGYRSLSIRTKYKLRFAVTLIPMLAALALDLLGIYYYQIVSIIISIATIFMFIRYFRKNIRLINDIDKLDKQIDKIMENDDAITKADPELKKKSQLYLMSEKISAISDRAERAIENQVQSEKLKVELVTNVSHDLKTPLTSIISYIDLLEKSELSEEAADYVKIISRKSDKLRDIVSDVFTLAKAVSGVEVMEEELDLAILLRQVLADSDDKAEQSGRELRTEISVDEAPIIGDGNKLYRVIQNLLDNALKYSMEGTRIYIRLGSEMNRYTLSVKNVSAYEMKFTPEEITERFTRGDKSRSDGGSGLGLSIAKSFTEACGGRFNITLDDDVFLATVEFERREEDGIQ